MTLTIRSLIVVCILCLSACGADKSDTSQSKTNATELENISIRLDKDPQQLSPFYSPSSRGRQVYQYVFVPLADYHTETLELSPVLLTEVPDGIMEKKDGKEVITFNMTLRPEAKWSDGQAITNRDVVFTYNVILHPLGKAVKWKPLFTQLVAVTADEKDEKKFSVSFERNYMVARDAASTIFLLPAHIYDPNHLIKEVNLDKLRTESKETYSSELVAVYDKANNSANEKESIIQAGPYKVTSSETNQFIQLERIEDYWGEDFPKVNPLQSHAQKLTFKIVPDEVTAVTMLKEGALDVLSMSQSSTFLELRDDETSKKKFSFHIPQLNRYYYLGFNNKQTILRDKKVRKALSHLADIDDFIATVEKGLGTRTVGHFHPVKPYYHDGLTPIPYDLQKAKELLYEAGWKDLDNDGILDKVIDGQVTPLELDILLTGSNTSKNIALIFQAATIEAGVKINLVTKSNSIMRKEYLYPGNYDIAILVVGLDSNIDDPYPRWHSDNVDNSRLNVLKYSNPELDQEIEKVRQATDSEQRKKHYYAIQEIIHEDQPCIFMYCPLNKIVINNSLEASTTSKRPGYLANTFKAR